VGNAEADTNEPSLRESPITRSGRSESTEAYWASRSHGARALSGEASLTCASAGDGDRSPLPRGSSAPSPVAAPAFSVALGTSGSSAGTHPNRTTAPEIPRGLGPACCLPPRVHHPDQWAPASAAAACFHSAPVGLGLAGASSAATASVSPGPFFELWRSSRRLGPVSFGRSSASTGLCRAGGSILLRSPSAASELGCRDGGFATSPEVSTTALQPGRGFLALTRNHVLQSSTGTCPGPDCRPFQVREIPLLAGQARRSRFGSVSPPKANRIKLLSLSVPIVCEPRPRRPVDLAAETGRRCSRGGFPWSLSRREAMRRLRS